MSGLRTVVDNTKGAQAEQPTLLEAACMVLGAIDANPFGGVFGPTEALVDAVKALRAAIHGGFSAVHQADGHSDAIDHAEAVLYGGPTVKTPCPSCGLANSLFVSNGGHLVCGVIGCKDPSPEHVAQALTARAEAAEQALKRTQLTLAILRPFLRAKEITDAEKVTTTRALLDELAPPPAAA